MLAFRHAVGLSAISFSAPLQKDAVSIPNALEAAKKINPCNPLLSEGDFYKLLFERFMILSLRRFLFFSKEHSELCD